MHYILHKKLNWWNKKKLCCIFQSLKLHKWKTFSFFGTVWIWPWNPLTNGVHLIIFQRNYCTPHLESTIFVALFRNKKNYINNGILFRKLFWPSVRRKNILVVVKNFCKCEAEGREVMKFLGSLEKFIWTVKGQNIFWKQNT